MILSVRDIAISTCLWVKNSSALFHYQFICTVWLGDFNTVLQFAEQYEYLMMYQFNAFAGTV